MTRQVPGRGIRERLLDLGLQPQRLVQRLVRQRGHLADRVLDGGRERLGTQPRRVFGLGLEPDELQADVGDRGRQRLRGLGADVAAMSRAMIAAAGALDPVPTDDGRDRPQGRHDGHHGGDELLDLGHRRLVGVGLGQPAHEAGARGIERRERFDSVLGRLGLGLGDDPVGRGLVGGEQRAGQPVVELRSDVGLRASASAAPRRRASWRAGDRSWCGSRLIALSTTCRISHGTSFRRRRGMSAEAGDALDRLDPGLHEPLRGSDDLLHQPAEELLGGAGDDVVRRDAGARGVDLGVAQRVERTGRRARVRGARGTGRPGTPHRRPTPRPRLESHPRSQPPTTTTASNGGAGRRPRRRASRRRPRNPRPPARRAAPRWPAPPRRPPRRR